MREKGKLAEHLPADGYLVLHAEDPGCLLLNRSACRARVISFGQSNRADMQFGEIFSDESGTRVTLRFFGERIDCRLQACGPFQAHNAAAAALVAYALGMPIAEIRDGLEQTPPFPRRFEIHRFRGNLTVIDDTFSANLDNLLLGLDHAAALAGSRRRLAVLSGMALAGPDSESFHWKAGQHAISLGFSDLYLVGPDGAEAIRAGAVQAGLASQQIRQVSKAADLAEELKAVISPDTLIYCKGSIYSGLGTGIKVLLTELTGAGFEPLAPGT